VGDADAVVDRPTPLAVRLVPVRPGGRRPGARPIREEAPASRPSVTGRRELRLGPWSWLSRRQKNASRPARSTPLRRPRSTAQQALEDAVQVHAPIVVDRR
jgi:hypothetical protein